MADNDKQWDVRLTRGETVRVIAERIGATDHGHLEATDGSVFARGEWQCVNPVPRKQEVTDEEMQRAIEYLLASRLAPAAVIEYLNDYLEVINEYKP